MKNDKRYYCSMDNGQCIVYCARCNIRMNNEGYYEDEKGQDVTVYHCSLCKLTVELK